METHTNENDIWVLGDYRNYFQSRVTLQILARARALAEKTGGRVAAVVLGHGVDEYVGEYIAHGADLVYVTDHAELTSYSVETYSHLLTQMLGQYGPSIFLVGATRFGQEIAPRVAKALNTGLTADCIDLDLDEKGCLVQTAPSFGGNLIAQIITPKARPQMATVRPGTFQELPHNQDARGQVVSVDLPQQLPRPRVRCRQSAYKPAKTLGIEKADIVITGGRGMGSKRKFKKLFELAEVMGAEVGATRPVVYSDWIGHDALVGQAGKAIRPKVLLAFGISGAIQHTAAITDADFIVAVNKNPNATMMKMADVAIVADASQVCSAMIKILKQTLRD